MAIDFDFDFAGALTGSLLFDLVIELALSHFGEDRQRARITFSVLCIYYVPVLPCDLAEKHLRKLAAVADTAAPAREAIPDRQKRLELAGEILALAAE